MAGVKRFRKVSAEENASHSIRRDDASERTESQVSRSSLTTNKNDAKQSMFLPPMNYVFSATLLPRS